MKSCIWFRCILLLLSAPLSALATNFSDCITFLTPNYSNFEQRCQAAESCQGQTDLECAKIVTPSYSTMEQRIEAVASCKIVVHQGRCETGTYWMETRVDLDCLKIVTPSYSTMEQRAKAAKVCTNTIPKC